MIVEMGNRRAAVHLDVEAARYAADHEVRHATKVRGLSLANEKRAVVEVHHRVGGNPQRALLGGVLAPAPSDNLDIVVCLSGEITMGATRSCPGSLGRDLVPGLPREFAAAVILALDSGLTIPGVLMVDRAAYDEVESSARIFRIAAALFAEILMCEGGDEEDSVVRRQLENWR